MEQDHSPRVAVGATGAVWQQPPKALRVRDVPLLWGNLTSPQPRSAQEGGEALSMNRGAASREAAGDQQVRALGHPCPPRSTAGTGRGCSLWLRAGGSWHLLRGKNKCLSHSIKYNLRHRKRKWASIYSFGMAGGRASDNQIVTGAI